MTTHDKGRARHELERAISALDMHHTSKAVLRAIASYGHWQTGTRMFPAVASLARDTGYSVRTVQYHMRRLETAGYLVLVADALGRRPAEYALRNILPEQLALDELAARRARPSDFGGEDPAALLAWLIETSPRRAADR